MTKVFAFWKGKGLVSIILSVILSVLVVVTVVEAATTISTNIETDGTLAVTGASTLTGNVTAAGTLSVTGASTLTGLTSMVQASSTRFTVHDTSYFGGTATTTINSAGAITIGDGTSITKHLSATASLNFAALGAHSCEALTITVTGAADGDTVALGVPNALASASTTFAFSGWVSAADTVTMRLCQTAAEGSNDPAAATVRADVWQH